MVTGWDIYWLTRLDNICIFLAVIWVLSFIVIIVSIFVGIFALVEDNDEIKNGVKQVLRRFVPIAILLSIPAIFLPNTKEYAAIWLLPKVINNEQVQKIPEHALKLLNLKVEQWIADMTSDKKK